MPGGYIWVGTFHLEVSVRVQGYTVLYDPT